MVIFHLTFKNSGRGQANRWWTVGVDITSQMWIQPQPKEGSSNFVNLFDDPWKEFKDTSVYVGI